MDIVSFPQKIKRIPLLKHRYCGCFSSDYVAVIGGSAIPFLRKYIIAAAKRVGADLLESAVPEIAEVVSVRKNFKTAAKSVRRQTLRKQLGSGSVKSTASRVIRTKMAKQISRSRRDIFTNISQ